MRLIAALTLSLCSTCLGQVPPDDRFRPVEPTHPPLYIPPLPPSTPEAFCCMVQLQVGLILAYQEYWNCVSSGTPGWQCAFIRDCEFERLYREFVDCMTGYLTTGPCREVEDGSQE